jgi:hypothetical protein
MHEDTGRYGPAPRGRASWQVDDGGMDETVKKKLQRPDYQIWRPIRRRPPIGCAGPFMLGACQWARLLFRGFFSCPVPWMWLDFPMISDQW